MTTGSELLIASLPEPVVQERFQVMFRAPTAGDAWRLWDVFDDRKTAEGARTFLRDARKWPDTRTALVRVTTTQEWLDADA